MISKRLSIILVTILILLIIILATGRLIHYVLTGESNAEFISSILHPCKEFPIIKSSRMAIIRIDDIQAYFLEDISIKMMDDAKSRGIPLSLGVIPKSIDENTPIHRYLKKNLCWVEIAQHGWDHQGITPDTPEFYGVDKATATSDFNRGEVILENLAKEKITTFIPPLNSISDDAREAIVEAGIRIISSEGMNKFDYGATSFNFLTSTANSPETILRDCKTRVAQTSLCVVMIHPQDFTTKNALDPVKYAMYLDILDSLQAANYTFVRFKDLVDQE